MLGNDTLSQVSGTFFGCLSVWLLYVFFQDEGSNAFDARRIVARNILGSIVAFAIALLSKERQRFFFCSPDWHCVDRCFSQPGKRRPCFVA